MQPAVANTDRYEAMSADSDMMPMSVPEVDLTLEMPENFGDQLRRSSEQVNALLWKWVFCRMFLAGSQYVSRSGNAIVPIAPLAGRTMIVANKLKPIYKLKLAQCELNYPDVQVLPASPETTDIRKAIATEFAMRYMAYKVDLHGEMTEAIRYMLVDGTSALHYEVVPSQYPDRQIGRAHV